LEQPGVALSILLLAIVVAIVVGGPIIFILRRIPGYRRARDQGLAAAADGERLKAEYAQAGLAVKSGFFSGLSVSGTLSGMRFSHRIVPGGRNSPPRVELSTQSPLRGEFAVRREGGSESFFKAIGFAGEAQTGDAAFDREFYLGGVSRDYVQALFSDAENRDAVRALFALGFDSIELQEGQLTAARRAQTQLLELSALRDALAQLAALRTTASAMQVAMQGLGGLRTRHVDAACMTAMGVAITAFMGTLHFLEPMVDGQFAMLIDSWRAALIIYGVLVALSLLLLRGRANAPRELLMIALIGLPSVWIGGTSTATLANQYLDPSPPQTVRVLLVRHYETRGKDRSYHLVFQPWGKRHRNVDIAVPLEIYRKAAPQQMWVLETRAGRFGYAWVDTLEPQTKR